MNGSRPLTTTEVAALLAAATDPRSETLLLSGLCFGLRVSESLALTFGHVSGGFLAVKSAKGSNNATFPIPQQFAQAIVRLREWYQGNGVEVTDTTPLFRSQKGGVAMSRVQAHRLIVDCAKRAGLDGKVASHSLRKCFVGRVYAASGNDIAQTRIYSRHKSLNSLQYYLAVSEVPTLAKDFQW